MRYENSMLRIGIIGCGGISNVHNQSIKALSKSKAVELVAVSDVRREQCESLAKLWQNVAIYDDAQEMLDKENLDVVHVCVPSYLHTKYAVMAIEKGCHTLIEKPVCLTEDDMKLLEEAQSKSSVKIMVGQVLRFFNEYLFLKDAYDKKTYGELQSFVMKRLSPLPNWGHDDWFSDPEKSGTVMCDLHIHDSDFVRFMLGEPSDLEVNSLYKGNQPIQSITTYIFENKNLLVSAEGSWNNPANLNFEAGYRAVFEKATVVYNSNLTQTVSVHSQDEISYPDLKNRDLPSFEGEGINFNAIEPYYNEIAYFIDCIENDKPIERATLSEGIKSVRLVKRELTLNNK